MVPNGGVGRSCERQRRAALAVVRDSAERFPVAAEGTSAKQLRDQPAALEVSHDPAGRLRSDAEEGAHVEAVEFEAGAVAAQRREIEQQMGDPGFGRAGRELDQRAIRIIDGALPAQHELLRQVWRVKIEMLDGRERDVADLDFVQGDGRVFVCGSDERFHPRDIARLEQAHDALGSVGQVAHQLEQPAPHNVERRPVIAHSVEHVVRRIDPVVDDQEGMIERLDGQVGE